MFNTRLQAVNLLLKNRKFTKKIQLYFSTLTAGDDFDPEENNYTVTNLNPITIVGLVTQIEPEKLLWKNYGFAEGDAVQVICDAIHKDKFKICSSVTIDTDEYQVFNQGVGGNALIQDRPGHLIRVILKRK